ncbi:hypothetical protein [Arthrospiribacter ruber]|uniref:Lipoprotein n=1 Tax=Arthrospiribacter ruber TaxID=2487934 RepID=A0A951IVV4_9BACT|nr:hypothetical protein [Arthrospiribacter ruber]MBW3467027.1 hypothetical protein [Arthrospiribacter ruber]
MKNPILLLLALSILIFSCDTELPEESITITYEVITENDVAWSGEFKDANGQRVLTFDLDEFTSEADGHSMPSGWRYSFQPTVQPIELLIAATAFCAECDENTQRSPSPSITANIYINDKLVWTETDNCRECTAENLKGLATSWYKLPEEWETGD